jgi:hypothetical protein
MSEREPAFLCAVVDTLLPADEMLPSGTATGVAAALAKHLRAHRDRDIFTQVLDAIAAQSGGEDGFVAADEAVRVETLKSVEQEAGAAFEQLVALVLADYCEAAVVLGALGWRPDPPQPRGFELAPFDESLLVQARRRTRLWRDPRHLGSRGG